MERPILFADEMELGRIRLQLAIVTLANRATNDAEAMTSSDIHVNAQNCAGGSETAAMISEISAFIKLDTCLPSHKF